MFVLQHVPEMVPIAQHVAFWMRSPSCAFTFVLTPIALSEDSFRGSSHVCCMFVHIVSTKGDRTSLQADILRYAQQGQEAQASLLRERRGVWIADVPNRDSISSWEEH